MTPEIKTPEIKPEDKIADIKAFTKNVIASMQGEPPPKVEAKPEEKKPDEPPVTPAVEPVAATPAATPATPEEKKPDPKPEEKPAEPTTKPVETPAPVVAPVVARLDQDQMDQLAKSIRPEPAPVVVPEDKTLTDRQRKDLEVFKHMEALDPKYSGISARFSEFSKQQQAYQVRWEAANPGKRFNINDEAHSEFMDAAAPQFDEDDFEEAKIDLRAERIVASRDEKLRNELESKTAQKEIPAAIEAKFNHSASVVINEIGKDIGEKLKTKEGVEALRKEDPFAIDQIDNVMAEMHSIAEEAARFDDPRLRYEFNPKDPTHVLLQSTANKMNAAFQSDPASRLGPNGKQYVSPWEFDKLTPQQKAAHWTFGTNDILYVISKQKAVEAKKKIDNFHSYAEQMAKSKAPATPAPVTPTTQATPPSSTPKPVTPSAKPQSPTTATASDIEKSPSVPLEPWRVIRDNIARGMR